MEFELKITGYRCFTNEQPAQFLLRPGFTALVGTNNAGKSIASRRFRSSSIKRFALFENIVERNRIDLSSLYEGVNLSKRVSCLVACMS
jgi:hypothetical protein